MRSTDIADWFLARAGDSGPDSITNMKLQKLVYLAESAFGSVHHDNLVDEPIQAWQHGPVIYSLWDKYRDGGGRAIPPTSEGPEVPEDIQEILEAVWDTFGDASASYLRNLTHDVGPYARHYQENVRGIQIPKNEVHGSWHEFVERGDLRKCRPDGAARRKMRALTTARSAHSAQEPSYDISTLMDDYRAFAPESASHT